MIKKFLEAEVKSVNKEEGTFEVVASSGKVDRLGDAIDPKGWYLKNYKKNPVVLWSHSTGGFGSAAIPPVAKADKVWVEDEKELKIKGHFADTPFAQELRTLVEGGFLNAVSVGFLPLIEKEKGDIEIEGKFYRRATDEEVRKGIYDSEYGEKFTKQELLEVSWVSVPALPQALISARKMNLALVTKALEDIQEKGVISYAVHGDGAKAPEGEGWNAGAEIKKATGDAMKLKKMHTWVDSGAENFDPEERQWYKLPHHKGDGSQAVVWRGVVAAMGALLGARGGVEIPDADRKGVYNHLAKHYKQFDKEPPEFKEYSEEELEDIARGEKETYNCECLDCGHIFETENHCSDVKCPKCGGGCRRVGRPGPGKEYEKPYPNEHSCRLKDPKKYDKFARKNCAAKHDGKCIDHVYGIKEGKSELQAMRYDKEVWTEGDARSHCKDTGGTFEPASKKKELTTEQIDKIRDFISETEKAISVLKGYFPESDATPADDTKGRKAEKEIKSQAVIDREAEIKLLRLADKAIEALLRKLRR